MSWVHRTMLVKPGPALDFANQLVSVFPSSKNLWSVAVGKEDAEWMLGAGLIQKEFADLMPSKTWALNENSEWYIVDEYSGSPELIQQIAADNGFTVQLQQIQWLFGQIDISTNPWDDVKHRLGIEIIQTDV